MTKVSTILRNAESSDEIEVPVFVNPNRSQFEKVKLEPGQHVVVNNIHPFAQTLIDDPEVDLIAYEVTPRLAESVPQLPFDQVIQGAHLHQAGRSFTSDMVRCNALLAKAPGRFLHIAATAPAELTADKPHRFFNRDRGALLFYGGVLYGDFAFEARAVDIAGGLNPAVTDGQRAIGIFVMDHINPNKFAWLAMVTHSNDDAPYTNDPTYTENHERKFLHYIQRDVDLGNAEMTASGALTVSDSGGETGAINFPADSRGHRVWHTRAQHVAQDIATMRLRREGSAILMDYKLDPEGSFGTAAVFNAADGDFLPGSVRVGMFAFNDPSDDGPLIGAEFSNIALTEV